MGHFIRATNLWGYDELVSELGGDPVPFLSRFHVPAAAQRADDSFLPYRDTVLLLEATAVELGCPDLGLRLARWQGLRMLGPIAVIARNTGTVGAALQAIARYMYIHCPSLQLEISQASTESIRADYQITELSLPQKRQAYELSMANAVQILRLLAGEEVAPTQMSFLHAQLGTNAAYSKAFGCEVRFEQTWCGFQIPVQLASKRINSADPQTLHLATTYLESEYAPSGASLEARVSELIRRLLPTGQCNAQKVAEQLAMHPRTLQRRLAEHGVRYEQLMDNERRDQARRHLIETGLHLSQITGLLGYAEQSAFHRSFRRWFGTTPKRYRAQMLSS